MELYDPEHNTWGVLAPMREARGRFNIAVVGDKVYAVGGCNGTTELATVECFDPKLGKWTRVTSLSLARSNTGQLLSFSLYMLGLVGMVSRYICCYWCCCSFISVNWSHCRLNHLKEMCGG